jgi:pyruvate ferredoxin oxidoreductase gamma subunit
LQKRAARGGEGRVTPTARDTLLAERLERGQTIDVRGEGKAGGGLILAMQAFTTALATRPELDAQEWPFFSSARKGANVRAFLRIARGQVEATCQVTAPDIAILMNEAAAESVDFAEGTREALYVINTTRSPEEAAARYRLGGTIATVAGDELGKRHLARPLGNVAVFAALVGTTRLVAADTARRSLTAALGKRRLPEALVTANLALYDEALECVRTVDVPPGDATDHRRPPFRGYGVLPAGAQAALRSSHKNRTSGYGRPGVRIEFADPQTRCNGCALCVAQCPEGIMLFEADPARGPLVRGARFDDFCKACRECITACPLDLFHEVAAVAPPDDAFSKGA